MVLIHTYANYGVRYKHCVCYKNAVIPDKLEIQNNGYEGSPGQSNIQEIGQMFTKADGPYTTVSIIILIF